MSCDYYARFKTCQECGRWDQKRIGGSAAGWPFILVNAKSFEDWLETVNRDDVEIYDEYGRKQSKTEFIEWVKFKQQHLEDKHWKDHLKDTDGRHEEIVDGWRTYQED